MAQHNSWFLQIQHKKTPLIVTAVSSRNEKLHVHNFIFTPRFRLWVPYKGPSGEDQKPRGTHWLCTGASQTRVHSEDLSHSNLELS